MPSEKLPTEGEWNEWLIHPCTKRLQMWAAKERMGLMEAWAEGNFAAAFTMEMAVKNAGATGACSVHKDFIELDYNQIVIGSTDDEPIRTDTLGPSGPGEAV